MGWIDAERLLRQASAAEDDFQANRYRLEAPTLAELDDRTAELLTAREAAERLDCSSENVRRLIRERRLPAEAVTRHGCRVWLIPHEAVDAYAATSPTFAARQAAATDRGGDRRLEVQA
jgi:excisionase family DNA binding protein